LVAKAILALKSKSVHGLSLIVDTAYEGNETRQLIVDMG
jgi:hypothetical protein